MKEVLQILVGGPILVVIAVLITWIGIYHGQWFSSNLLGRGETFRRQASNNWFWFPLHWIPCFVFVQPFTRGVLQNRSLLETVQRSPDCTIAFGAVLVGAIIGIRYTKPVGPIVAAIITCLLAPLAWFSMQYPMPGLRLPIFIAYILAVLIIGINLISWIRARISSEHIVTDIEEIQNPRLRETVLSLLKDGRLLTERPPVRRWRYAQARLSDCPAALHAYCRKSGIYFYANAGNESLYPFALGAEFLPNPVAWLFIPWTNLEIIKAEQIIGYSEVCLRLRNSGIQLRLEGVTRKQLARFSAAESGECREVLA